MAETGEIFGQPRPVTDQALNLVQLLSVNCGQIMHRQQMSFLHKSASRSPNMALRLFN
jgi:hypothetical protein